MIKIKQNVAKGCDVPIQIFQNYISKDKTKKIPGTQFRNDAKTIHSKDIMCLGAI